MTVEHLSETRFTDFDLAEPLLRGLQEAGFEFCTPIQAQSLPPLLEGRDTAGQAQTGTGKTIAFLVAVIQRLLTIDPPEGRRPNQPRALILAPTRELAIQIHREAEALLKHTGLSAGLAYGGADYERQRKRLQEGVDILIGTPGRLIDFFKQRVFDLRAIQAVVLDEADRMFDLGFIKDIRFLFRRMPEPERRLSMLFSATLSMRVTELAYEHMNNPGQVKIESTSVTAEKVVERVFYAGNEEKIPLLLGILKQVKPSRAIIFTNTKRAAERIDAYLEGNGFEAGLLSGDIPQKKRQRLLERFQQGELPLLVATDVAARGLHIPHVSHVINFDLPQNAEDYVHRIGRTGRAGESGEAISFACEEYAFHLPEIEEYIGHKIPSEPITDALLVEPAPPARRQRRPKPGGAGPRKRSGPGDRRREGAKREGERPKRPRRRNRKRRPEGGS